MPSPSTQVAPSTLASIQAFVSRAGFFWRGGAVALAIVFGASLALAMIVGDTFESESVVELDAQSAQERPADGRVASADEQLRGALVDPASIEQLAREVTPGPLEGPMLSKAVERVRGSIELRPKGERRYGVVFRAPTAGASVRASGSR